ncbi:MAG: SOS response-associated peptidase family protein [Smithella sp.]|nr:SOS response-associated peptidase family protein [Smithella sp.]
MISINSIIIRCVIREICQLVCYRWGLIPSWSGDPSIAERLINARAETVDKKPSFKDAFKKRRCLIVAESRSLALINGHSTKSLFLRQSGEDISG